MRIVVGILCLVVWLLYIGQVITVLDFGLAQRLGLQEAPEHADPLHSHLELWAARWDMWWLWTLPAAGIVILLDLAWWPYAAMIGGSAFVDTGGREAAKAFGLRQHGVRTGSVKEQRRTIGTFAYFITIGLLAIVTGLLEVS